MKPTNIMIKEDKDTKEIEVRISDFGTCKSLKGKPSETLVKGSPIYIPPEYINIGNDDKILTSDKHDIFSLGIIAHQLFANGLHPFEGSSKMANISNGKYVIDYNCIKKDSPIDLIIKGIKNNFINYI